MLYMCLCLTPLSLPLPPLPQPSSPPPHPPSQLEINFCFCCSDYGFFRKANSDLCEKISDFKKPDIDVCLRGHEEEIITQG